jgi:hypothetical protein
VNAGDELAVTVLVVKFPGPIDHENVPVLVATPDDGIASVVGLTLPAAPPPLVRVTVTVVPRLETGFPHWSVTLTDETKVGAFPVSLQPNTQLTGLPP